MSEDSIEDQKSIENESQHCSAESKAKIEAISSVSLSDESHSTGVKSNIENIYANGINFAELNETVHHTEDSLDSFELIDYPDPDEIQIAGFNKKKLLEMCTFSKMTYGNNDIKLSEAGYKTKAELIDEGYNIIPFYYSNKTLAGFVFTKDREITIAYRGTQGFDDIMTDVNVWLTIPEFLSEGGRVHYGFYNSFEDSRKCLADIIKTYADEQKLEIKDFKFYLTGHSMGGAIAKIAALFLNKKLDVQDLHVTTFADPRVFDLTASEIYNKALPNRTVRVTQHRCDPIPAVAPGILGYVHVGEQLRVSVIPEYTIHKIDGYHQAIKESDFQPDNSASIFYYPVRLLILINDIVLGNSQYYAANFIRYFSYQENPYVCFNAIENTNHMSVIPISTITFNPLGHNIQLRMSMILAVRKPDQAIGMIKSNNFRSDNNVSTFYSSIRVLTPVNNGVLVRLFNRTSCNVNSHFGRKVGFITQDSGFSNRNKRIKAIQDLSLVEVNNQQKRDDLFNDVSFDKKGNVQQLNVQSPIIEDFNSIKDLSSKPTSHIEPSISDTNNSTIANDHQTQVIVDKIANNNRKLSLTKKAVYATMIASPFIATGIYAAVALSAGIAEFNPIVAAGIFVGVATLAVMCFVIAKVCEKVNEEKSRNPSINLSTAFKNALTLECFRSSETAIPDPVYVN